MPPKRLKGGPSATSVATTESTDAQGTVSTQVIETTTTSGADADAADETGEEGGKGKKGKFGKGKFGKGGKLSLPKGKFFGKGKGKKFSLGKKNVQIQDGELMTESGTQINPLDLSASQQDVYRQAMGGRSSIGAGGKRRLTALGLKHQPEEFHYVGFYRHIEKQLPLAIEAHHRAFPWPPKGAIFFSSGYYMDWASKKGIEFLTNTLKIHNVPPDVTEAQIRAGFQGDPIIQMGKTTTIKYPDVEQAKDAYINCKHVKLGGGELLFLRGGDFYITNIPKNTTEKHIRALYPDAIEIKVVHNGPGGESYAYVRFANDEERNAAFYNGPLPLNEGDGTIDGTDVVKRATNLSKNPQPNPNEIWITGIPNKNAPSEEDILKFFPNATGIKFEKMKGKLLGGKKYAVITFNTAEDANQTSGQTSTKYFKNIGPRQFQIIKRLPKSTDVDDDDLEGLSDLELAKRLGWKPPDAEYSNISNLFKPTIYLSNLPKDTTRTELLKQFPDAKKIDLKRDGRMQIGTIEFGDALQAAQSFSKARRLDLNGVKPIVSVHGPPGGGGKGKKKSVR